MILEIAVVTLAGFVFSIIWKGVKMESRIMGLESQIYILGCQIKEARQIVVPVNVPMAPISTQLTAVEKKGRTQKQRELASKLKKEWWAKKKASERKLPEAVNQPLIGTSLKEAETLSHLA